jgi:hypothetical protein
MLCASSPVSLSPPLITALPSGQPVKIHLSLIFFTTKKFFRVIDEDNGQYGVKPVKKGVYLTNRTY